jgi:hypothetical protein
MPEPVAGFKAAYPSFQLEDELFPEGERCYGQKRIQAQEEGQWLGDVAVGSKGLGVRARCAVTTPLERPIHGFRKLLYDHQFVSSLLFAEHC